MEKEIIVQPDELYEKRYKLRKSGKDGVSIEVTVPRIILEYEARKRGLSVDEALARFEGVWKFNNLKGVYLFVFEEREKKP